MQSEPQNEFRERKHILPLFSVSSDENELSNENPLSKEVAFMELHWISFISI